MSQTDVAAVEAANAEFYAAFEAVDIDRMHAVWDDEEDVTCVHPGWPMLRGRGRVMRSWALIFANTPYIQFFLTDVRADVLGESAVVTCCENILTSVGDSAGDALVVATNVFRLRAEGWRLVVHHGSPVVQTADREEET
jgi:ketosteroid isomerase-like protein